MKIVSVIVRTTEACNLGCSYCYVNKSTSNKVIPVAFIEKLVQGLVDADFRVINIYWHGGEPLLAGRDFYYEAVQICKSISEKSDVTISNRMQSNATLIDQEWIDFFRENDFRVGTSLDGISAVNDKNRLQNGGQSSFQKAVRGIKLMQSNGLDTSMLAVLTREHMNSLDEHYAFVKEMGVRTFKVNPCIVNKVEETHLQVQPVEWGQAMCHLFDLWFDDPMPPRNREFSSLIKSFFVGRHSLCTNCKTCFKNFLSIVPSGEMYPCAKLINDDPIFALGNVNDGIERVLLKYSHLERKYDELGCNSCKWEKICYGGCTAYAYWSNKDINTKDYLCEGYKLLYQHVYDRVEKAISQNDNAKLKNLGIS